jgi:hypothetical protein
VGCEVLRFGEVRDFPLADLLDLPGTAGEEADLEGVAVADGFLLVVGSHGLKRKNAKPDRDHADNAKRLAKVTLDGNRRLLACLPVEPDSRGEPCLVRQAQDGRRALRLNGDSQTNLLTRALVDDPHFGRYMALPDKDNGFDIEGLAVDGRRLLLGLRGPVLRGWSALLEVAVEIRSDQPCLAPRCCGHNGTLSMIRLMLHGGRWARSVSPRAWSVSRSTTWWSSPRSRRAAAGGRLLLTAR